MVIPNLAMGVLKCRELVPADEMDRFMNTLLRAVRIDNMLCFYVALSFQLTTKSEDISPSHR